MEKLLDIQFMSTINQNNPPPEEVFGYAIRNLHIVENYFVGKQSNAQK